MVKTYKAKHQADAIRHAQRDAEKHGWIIESMHWEDGRAGCLRFFLIGFFAFFWRPKGELTVVLAGVA